MAMNGDFFAKKEHVRTEMKQRLEALAEDRVLAKKEKERVIETAVCCYSAGVDWTGAELNCTSKMWTRAYKCFTRRKCRFSRQWESFASQCRHFDQ